MSGQFAKMMWYVQTSACSFVIHHQEIVNHGGDQVWRTIESHIRLVHVNTSQALKVRYISIYLRDIHYLYIALLL